MVRKIEPADISGYLTPANDGSFVAPPWMEDASDYKQPALLFDEFDKAHPEDVKIIRDYMNYGATPGIGKAFIVAQILWRTRPWWYRVLFFWRCPRR